MSFRRLAADLIERAYAEDLADAGDITSAAVLEPGHRSACAVVARQAGTISGLEVAGWCFEHVDPAVGTELQRNDGATVDAGTVLMTINGPTASVLTAERVALNLLGRMSGIATATRSFVDAVAGTGAAICDTRKTTPTLRFLEKRAVVDGGGQNHRFGLYDAVLIKDNHLAAASSIAGAVRSARRAVGADVTVEVEVDTLAQLEEVLGTDADVVLLDNMAIDDLSEAVAMVDGRMTTEASGGVDLTSVRSIAETGVDIISVGWLTHSAPVLDVALDFVDNREP